MFYENPNWIPLFEISEKIWEFLAAKIPDQQPEETGAINDPFEPYVFVKKRDSTSRGSRPVLEPVEVSGDGSIVRTLSEEEVQPHEEPRAGNTPELIASYAEYYGWLCDAVVWSFLKQQREARVLLTNGQSGLVSSAVYTRESNFSGSSNNHIDIRIGTIGSGHRATLIKPNRQGANQIKLEEVYYGNFLYQPIAFKRTDFEQFFKNLKEKEFLEFEPTSEEIVQQIVELYRSEKVTDEEAKRRIAPFLTRDAWQEHRRAAAVREPLVKKRGPKGPRS
ncbi:hypothetical protein [Ruegeria arenilitoris]|uniref:hypothetical protein n=1 Tax=Ruegeria arenilitoris TaxID=1173585 RepID=UPI00147A4B2D|nr:hypothetical protein [Ruegeria arenilitoris]